MAHQEDMLVDDERLSDTERMNRTRARALFAQAEASDGAAPLEGPVSQMSAAYLVAHGHGHIETREVPHIIGTRKVDFFVVVPR